MKLKTLAVIAVSSILATSFAYAAPSAADASQQNLSATDNIGAMSGPNGNSQANSQGMDLSANNVESMPMETGDEMSADTATGDDDY
jgi:hypothetical protein